MRLFAQDLGFFEPMWAVPRLLHVGSWGRHFSEKCHSVRAHIHPFSGHKAAPLHSAVGPQQVQGVDTSCRALSQQQPA